MIIDQELLCFKPHFHVKIVNSKQVVLFSEDKQHLLQGFIYVAIAEIISNQPTSEVQLFDVLLTKFPFSCIQEALTRLKKKNFITKHDELEEKNVKSFWSDLELISNKSDQRIVIRNFSQHSSVDIFNALNSLSLTVNDEGDFFVVIVDNYICKELEDFNKERLKDGKPWMLLKPSGRNIWIGPIFELNHTGCWSCLAEKLKENRRVEVDLFGLDNHNLNIQSLTSLPTTYNIAINLAATEIAKWTRSKKSHRLCNHLFTFDLGNMESCLHPFQPKSSCLCQQSGDQHISQQFPKLNSCLKKHYFDEGERAYSLDDTFNNLKNILSPITGVVSTIRHSLVNDQHICYTVRTLPLPSELDFVGVNKYLRVPDVATGKGKTKLQATVGCIAEAVERYNCTFSTRTEIRCKYNDIKNEAIHPNELLNVSEFQYKNREQINMARPGFNQIPCPYDNSEIGWTSIYSITHDRFRYMPSSYLYLYYPFGKDLEMCPGSSNGCASGNTLEEATYYALLELIERDAVAIWWYNRIKRPSVNLQSLNNEFLNQTQAKFKKDNREFYVLDLTTDLQIPCYVAVSWKLDGSEIFFGTASHLQPDTAISRAISELNQVMIRANTPKNIDLMSIQPTERDLVKWSISETIENHPYLIPEGKCFPNKLHSDSNDFLTDITLLLKILKQCGQEVFLLDLTSPDIQFHTVKAIVPGLRHFWSRLGTGRLYDVPVRLRWLQEPLSELLMNSTPYFL